MRIKHRILSLTIICFALAACGEVIPDLGRLYSFQTPSLDRAASSNQPPVILIHGAFGSRLQNKNNKNEIWPGSLRRILFNDYKAVTLPIDSETLLPLESGLEVSGITDRVAGQDFYGQIISVLEDVGGFVRTEPKTPARLGEKRYYVFEYDWRLDNVESARDLDRFIEQIREDYQDPKLEVDVIAHSMGGLIARYFVRYGTVDVLNDNDFPVNNHGAEHLRRVILLGTPNFGSVRAVTIQSLRGCGSNW
ncbi:MAG: hypothetical protein AAF438_16205 [Pseudomonadota bacterium]